MNRRLAQHVAAGVTALMAVTGGAAIASTPTSSPPPASSSPSTTAPPTDGLSELDAVRRAKIGLAWFIVEHLDRPTQITSPCPTVNAASAAAHLGSFGLVPSAHDYGPAIVVDDEIGDGVGMIRCGVDLARFADPADSTSLSVDVMMLDGQATFEQYALELVGDDVVIEPLHDAGGEVLGESAGECRNDGTRCEWALDIDGLVVTVRLRYLPAESGEQLSPALLAAITPEIITNLAALAPNVTSP